ncbi:MAG: hypothetical protein BMS9Abin13_475 [Patescibacteria group bacterium]|nr:MAG: hypothetical protein BMS9Abin13_475 [Patescibacteria group bacterium]
MKDSGKKPSSADTVEEPYLVAFFNHKGGAIFLREDAFDFKKICVKRMSHWISSELKTVEWAKHPTLNTVVGYSKKNKIGFIAIDLRSEPPDKRDCVRPSTEQFIHLAELTEFMGGIPSAKYSVDRER